MPLTLLSYPARTLTNAQFQGMDLATLDRVFLPPALASLLDETPLKTEEFIEDDNRGAVSPEPVATLDGTSFHLSIKGVGSTIDPFSSRPLDRKYASELTQDTDVRRRFGLPDTSSPDGEVDRIITGELWLRGSPYGGQGLEHAQIALNVSERASLTSISGFLIAPVVKVAFLPPQLEKRLRTLHWYRRFRGPIVQELRFVPSNMRIYFHAKNTIGSNVGAVFDQFGLSSEEMVLQFEVRFIRSTLAMLTLFARTLRFDDKSKRYCGLDFHDVWLDKDAVLAPDGSVYFVDLEGIEEEAVDREKVAEKLEDQVFRSLYEFMFAYEQLEQERTRRFGRTRSRKSHFETLLHEALRDDPFLHLRSGANGLELEIRNPMADADLYSVFPIMDI
jgi:hypothetical protein